MAAMRLGATLPFLAPDGSPLTGEALLDGARAIERPARVPRPGVAPVSRRRARGPCSG
jgi:hypothetical protein